ncbi:DoxX family protein [Ancylobacter sp. SL191]|uniref:DoxX family protein n=1 Tax=Ancylobacter sp. SL191 TaxID=2995166 RepID=UPI002270762C|nr:DoxX family protein [Ancylobacter sp. SL191]WAC28230.1 DoxX family protein [Ancylobacter sp. SL191]
MIDTRSAPYGVFLLRVALGAMWVSHALLKYAVFTIPGFAGYLGSLGLPAGLAWPVFLAELTGGLLIISGVYARHVALLLIPVMAGAMSVHIPNGWLFSSTGGGWEYPGFLIVTSFALWLIGDGAFALRSRPLLFVGRPATA